MTAPSVDAASAPAAPGLPVRARGVELLGELAGSGYQRAPGLVRRADGQTVQLTPLLYRLLEQVDGLSTEGELAVALGARTGREVTADDVRVLLGRLRPLGLLRGDGGDEPVVVKSNPLLALRLKVVVADPELTWRITTPFARLFSPWVVVPVLLGFLASCWFLLLEKGLAAPTRAALYEPEMLLAVFALTVASAGYHEFGHAAACRYGGARPGAMGAGLYLVWPAFYTDVDDSYRLSRWGRLRVDLGGLYFNAQVAVAATAAWALLGQDALLLVVLTQLVQMLRQLAPFLRADGYHVLADLTGVPDLFSHLGSTLRAMLPRRWRPTTRTPLKRWARVVVTTWVLVTVPVLLGLLAAAVYVLPRLAATAADSMGQHADLLVAAAGQADLLRVLALLLKIVALALPVLGICYLLTRIVRRTVRRTLQVTEGRPAARGVAGLAGLLLLLLVAAAWWPAERYEPLRADERGTLPAVVEQLAAPAPAPARVAAPAVEPVAAVQPTRTVAPPPDQPTRVGPVAPVRAAAPAPAPAPVALRAALPAAPAVGPAVPHVLRLQLPDAPREGDNQALAVGDRDGRRVFAGAYALVYVTDGSRIDPRNTAYALATCGGCATTAVAFQVVLVVGDTRVVVPVNEAVAANDRCLQCVTTAIAVQVVATLERVPDAAVEAELRSAMAPLQGLRGRSVQLAPLELVEQVRAVESEVLAVLDRSGLVTATAPAPGVETGPQAPATNAATTDSNAAEPTVSPTAVPTLSPAASPTVSPAASPEASGEPATAALVAEASPAASPEPSTSPSPAATAAPAVSEQPVEQPVEQPSPEPASPEPATATSPTPTLTGRSEHDAEQPVAS